MQFTRADAINGKKSRREKIDFIYSLEFFLLAWYNKIVNYF